MYDTHATGNFSRRELRCKMKVCELIEVLQDCDEDAEVRIVVQPQYPLEAAIFGVAVREEYWGHDDGHENMDGDIHPNDVLICQGDALGYGVAAAWDVAIR